MPPRNIRLMPGVHYGVTDFDYYTQGYQLMANREQEEDLTDDIRHLLEQCDRPQGVQVFADIDNGFGGLAEKYLLSLRDEYPKTPVLVWGLGSSTAGYSAEKKQRNAVNVSFGSAKMSQHSSVFVPLMGFSPKSLFSQNEPIPTPPLYFETAPLAMAISTALYPVHASIPPASARTRQQGAAAGPLPHRIACSFNASLASRSSLSLSSCVVPLGGLVHSLTPLPSANIVKCAALMTKDQQRPSPTLLSPLPAGEEEKKGGGKVSREEQRRRELRRQLLFVRRGMQDLGGLMYEERGGGEGEGGDAKVSQRRGSSTTAPNNDGEIPDVLYAEEAVFRGFGFPSSAPGLAEPTSAGKGGGFRSVGNSRNRDVLNQMMRSKMTQDTRMKMHGQGVLDEDKPPEWQVSYEQISARDSVHHLAVCSSSSMVLGSSFPKSYIEFLGQKPASTVSASSSAPSPRQHHVPVVADLYSHSHTAISVQKAVDTLKSISGSRVMRQHATQYAKDDVGEEDWQSAKEHMENLIRDYTGKNLMGS